MGVVYLAQHRHLGREAAVKVLLPELSANEQVVRRFFTEAKATARILHPGIVEIFDCDITPGGQAYIVMEYLQGESLRARLLRVGDFGGDALQAVRIAGQVAAALTAAHAHGIVHRDLKPDNVFLTPGPQAHEALVKLLDFGIAKLISEKSESSTRSGIVLGTPLYMSPEQCRGARLVDHRTDIYSLGCVLFELLAGHPPFVREGSGDLLIAHATEPPPVLHEVRPEVAPELSRLVARMLRKNADERPRTMSEVEAALLQFGAHGDAGSRPATSKPPTPRSPADRGRPAPGVVRATTLGAAATESQKSKRHGAKRVLQVAFVLAVVGAAADGAGLFKERGPIAARGLEDTGGGGNAAPAAGVAVVPPPASRLAAAPPQSQAQPRTVEPRAIELTSDPVGAEVWVGREETSRGRTPFAIRSPDGEAVDLVVKKPGYADARVTLLPGAREPRHVTLDRLRRLTKSPEQSHQAGKARSPASSASSFRAVGD
jgi:serine/threonine-protein kinase